MKRKRLDRVERRRPLVEINLIAGTKARPARIARSGCARLFASVAAFFVGSAAAYLGLH